MSATEEHDYIQLQISNKFQEARIDKPRDYLISYKTKKNGSSQINYESFKYERFEEIAEWLITASGAPEKIDKPAFEVTWEMPIPGRYEPVGYVDLLIRDMVYEVNIYHLNKIHPIDEDDFCQDPDHWDHSVEGFYGPRVVAVEVKSHISSIGELLRQVNKYKAALPWCNCPYRYGSKVHSGDEGHYTPIFWVASPDDRFKDVIESQGITFKKVGE